MKKWNKIFKSKTFLYGVLGCLLVVSAVFGILSLQNQNNPEDPNIVMDAGDAGTEAVTEAPTEGTTLANLEIETTSENPSVIQVAENENVEAEEGSEETSGADEGEEVDTPIVNSLDFGTDSTLLWPVSGNVILDYSMDTTTYFATLKQYKTNDGILIQSEVGTAVQAPAAASVTSIDNNEELGNYITLDLGGGYTAVCGQIENMAVSVGDYVEEGTALGYVAEPTKYYVVEGSHTYFSLYKDGSPVDPLDYIR